MTSRICEETPLPAPFRRLCDLVQARGLHRGSDFHDPLAWLLDWMHTPRSDLDGRFPAVFTGQPDWDLVLAGLLLLPSHPTVTSCLNRVS